MVKYKSVVRIGMHVEPGRSAVDGMHDVGAVAARHHNQYVTITNMP